MGSCFQYISNSTNSDTLGQLQKTVPFCPEFHRRVHSRRAPAQLLQAPAGRGAPAPGTQHRMPAMKALGLIFKSLMNHLTGLAQNNYFQILLGSTKSCLSLSQDRDLGPHLWRHSSCLKPLAWNFSLPQATFLASITHYSGLFLLIPFLVSMLICKL